MKKFFLFFLVILLSFTTIYAQTLSPKAKSELSGNKKSACIIVESNVPGALVYLNSVYQGKTRLTVKNLLPSDYFLEVQKEGYKTQKFEITAKAGYILTYRVNLEIETEEETAAESEKSEENNSSEIL